MDPGGGWPGRTGRRKRGGDSGRANLRAALALSLLPAQDSSPPSGARDPGCRASTGPLGSRGRSKRPRWRQLIIRKPVGAVGAGLASSMPCRNGCGYGYGV